MPEKTRAERYAWRRSPWLFIVVVTAVLILCMAGTAVVSEVRYRQAVNREHRLTMIMHQLEGCLSRWEVDHCDREQASAPSLRAAWDYTYAHLAGTSREPDWPDNPYTGKPLREVRAGDGPAPGDFIYLRHFNEYNDGSLRYKHHRLIPLLPARRDRLRGLCWFFGRQGPTIRAYGLSPAEVYVGIDDPELHYISEYYQQYEEISLQDYLEEFEGKRIEGDTGRIVTSVDRPDGRSLTERFAESRQ